MLVVNPKATATTRKGRDILVRALGQQARVEMVETGARGDATTLAQQAADKNIDLIVALGGDGTVNEVVNGLLSEGVHEDLPMLAAVPGGSGNVFTRALGLSRNPIEATSQILDALRAGRSRWVGLGRADERWFTFAAGLGLDAEVVRRVEMHRQHGRSASPGLYVRSALRQFFAETERKHPALTLDRPGEKSLSGLYFGIVSNTSPWTYLGTRPVNPSPQAAFDAGLDLFAMTSMRSGAVLHQVVRSLRCAPVKHARHVVGLHDQAEMTFTVGAGGTADAPVALQLDGDYVGEVQPGDSVRFISVAQSLRVVV